MSDEKSPPLVVGHTAATYHHDPGHSAKPRPAHTESVSEKDAEIAALNAQIRRLRWAAGGVIATVIVDADLLRGRRTLVATSERALNALVNAINGEGESEEIRVPRELAWMRRQLQPWTDRSCMTCSGACASLADRLLAGPKAEDLDEEAP